LRLFLAGAVAALTVAIVVGCSDSDKASSEECLAALDRSCTPAYDPTFDNVFQKTFKPSCALAGTSCHAPAGAKAGLVFEDPAAAHRLLLERDRVVAGNPECSLVVRRTTSTDTSFQMPPGMLLPAGEQCAIVQWIARGAGR